jgi:hypothetical protein
MKYLKTYEQSDTEKSMLIHDIMDKYYISTVFPVLDSFLGKRFVSKTNRLTSINLEAGSTYSGKPFFDNPFSFQIKLSREINSIEIMEDIIEIIKEIKCKFEMRQKELILYPNIEEILDKHLEENPLDFNKLYTGLKTPKLTKKYSHLGTEYGFFDEEKK